MTQQIAPTAAEAEALRTIPTIHTYSELQPQREAAAERIASCPGCKSEPGQPCENRRYPGEMHTSRLLRASKMAGGAR